MLPTCRRRFVPILALLASLVVAAAPAVAADCKAEVKAKYNGQDEARDNVDQHVFLVEIKSRERCAKVEYEMTIVERSGNGETRTYTKVFRDRIRDAESKARKVNHRVDKGDKIQSWDFTLLQCWMCGTEP